MIRTNPKVPDGEHKWTIVFGAFMCYMIVHGFMFSAGIFLVYFVDHFNAPKAGISMIGALSIGCCYLFGPLSSILTTKYGFRTTVIAGSIVVSASICLSSIITTLDNLKLTYILIGIGFGVMYFSPLTCVIRHFESRRPLAVGIVFCGMSIGTSTFAPLSHLLLHRYDFDGTMIIFGALILNCIPFGLLLRPLENSPCRKKQQKCILHNDTEMQPNETLSENDAAFNVSETQLRTSNNFQSSVISRAPENEHGYSSSNSLLSRTAKAIFHTLNFHLFKNVAFLLLAIAHIPGMMCFTIPAMYVVHFAILKGIDGIKAPFLLSIYAISGLIGRIVFGLLASSNKISTFLIHNLCAFICGLSILVVPFFFSYLLIAVSVAVVGFTSAAMAALVPIIVVDFVGVTQSNGAIGLIGIFQGLSVIFTVPVSGYLFDITGNYNFTFYIGGSGVIFYAFLVFIGPRISKLLVK